MLTNLQKTIIAMVNLCGIVKVEDVVTTYNQHFNEDISVKELNRVPHIMDKLNVYDVYKKGDMFIHQRFRDDSKLSTLNESKKGKPVYKPSKFQLMQYVDETYVEQPQSYYKTIKYIETDLKLKVDAQNIVDDMLMCMLCDTNLNGIYQIFNDHNYQLTDDQ